MEQRLREWIDGQGFPLEMRVAEALRAANRWWMHGRQYEDPATGKLREIDLTGDLASDRRRRSVQLVIECKHLSKGRPWVVFSTGQDPLSPLGHVMNSIATDKMATLLEGSCSSPAIQDLEIFRGGPSLGFRLGASHSDNQDVAHQALSAAVAAARGLAARHSNAEHCVLYIPIVVVDTPLFLCHSRDSGYELSEVTEAQLMVDGGSSRCIVRVVQERQLPDFLHVNAAAASEFLRLVRDEDQTDSAAS